MKNVKSSEIGDLETIAMELHRPKLNHVKLPFSNTGTGSEVRSWVPPGVPWMLLYANSSCVIYGYSHPYITLLNIYSFGVYCVIVIILNIGGSHKIRDGDFLHNLHRNGMTQTVSMPKIFPGTLEREM